MVIYNRQDVGARDIFRTHTDAPAIFVFNFCFSVLFRPKLDNRRRRQENYLKNI